MALGETALVDSALTQGNARKAEKGRGKSISEGWFAWLLVGPAMLFILVIVAWPLAETVRLSFTNAGLGGEEYVGLENYEKLIESRKFHQTITRTFYWMFLSVILKLVMGLIGAVLLLSLIHI